MSEKEIERFKLTYKHKENLKRLKDKHVKNNLEFSEGAKAFIDFLYFTDDFEAAKTVAELVLKNEIDKHKNAEWNKRTQDKFLLELYTTKSLWWYITTKLRAMLEDESLSEAKVHFTAVGIEKTLSYNLYIDDKYIFTDKYFDTLEHERLPNNFIVPDFQGFSNSTDEELKHIYGDSLTEKIRRLMKHLKIPYAVEIKKVEKIRVLNNQITRFEEEKKKIVIKTNKIELADYGVTKRTFAFKKDK